MVSAIPEKVATQLVMILAQAQAERPDQPTRVAQMIDLLNQNPFLSWGIAGFIVLALVTAALAIWAGNIDNILGFRLNYFTLRKKQLTEEQLRALRRQLLKIMKGDVAQRLEDSLHHLVKVDVAWEEQRYQVGRSASTLVKEDLESVHPLSNPSQLELAVFGASEEIAPVAPSAPIYSILHRSDIGERLLILGEPGAGKTTELLMVAKQLIEDAIEDTDKPIPVIFDLSSWIPGQPIVEWFGVQLIQQYGISAKLSHQVAKQWVQQNTLLPLLDGLDSLGPRNQAACVHTVEDFLKTHQSLSVLVCCRKEEYEQGEQKLTQLKGAVCLKSLSLEQIYGFLKDLKRESLWDNLQAQPELLELAKTPLFLTMLVVAHQGQPIQDKATLFESYIQKQLQDPNNQGTYRPGTQKSPEQIQHYLRWLAIQLEEKRETEFLIENLQPSWLDSYRQRAVYRLSGGLMIALIGGFIGGLSNVMRFVLSFGVSSVLRGGWLGWLGFGLTIMLGGGLVGWLIGAAIQAKESANQGIRKSIQNALSVGVIFGLSFGLGFGLSFGLMAGVMLGLVAGVSAGLMAGLSVAIQHLTLRILLTLSGNIPWDYSRFLKHAVKHRFLQRTGDRHRFIHALLRKHFAQMPTHKTGLMEAWLTRGAISSKLDPETTQFR